MLIVILEKQVNMKLTVHKSRNDIGYKLAIVCIQCYFQRDER